MTMVLRIGGGDQSLNNSAKEGLKQAMLRHELIFRNQVRELHRLYWTQKNLMRELCRKATKEQTEAGVPASAGIRLAVGLEMAQVSCSRDEANVGAGRSLPIEVCGLYARGVIDLEESVELESNEEANATVPSSRTWSGSGLVLAENNSHAGLTEIPREQKPNNSGSELKGSTCVPSIDTSTQKQISTACKIWHIDLNIAQDDESFNVLNDSIISFPSPSTSSSIVHHVVLQRESSYRCSKETITHQPEYTNPSSSISGENNADWLFHGCQNVHHCSTQASAESTKVTENSWKHEHDTINKVLEPDSTGPAKCYRTTAEEFYTSSDGGVQNSMNGIAPSPTGLCKLGAENADSSSGQPHSFVHSDSRRQASIVTVSNDIDYYNQHASVGSTNLLPTVTGDSDDKQTNCDGSEEDTVSSHAIARGENQQDGLLEEFPVARKSAQTTGNNDCSAVDKSAERQGVLPISEDSGTTRLDTSAAESIPREQVPFPETCDHVCLKDKVCYIGKPEPEGHLEQQQAQAAEMDCMIAKAAETLISISLEKPAYPSDPLATVELTEMECEERIDQPQYSSDSFESITLKLSEIRDDKCLMSARSTEKAAGKDVPGVKLRRGRGMRDFQKDILPGLVSLSRQEIREDLHTIGYELRKNRSRQACRENWSMPVRSKRLRLYSVGRRH